MTAVHSLHEAVLLRDTLVCRLDPRRNDRSARRFCFSFAFFFDVMILLIRDTNAHAFFGEKQEFEEVPPNIEYSSKQFYGLEYCAIRPILAGDY